MAGYIMTLSDKESLQDCFYNGCYGTYFKNNDFNKWNITKEGTFADYSTMKPGDHIYFFINRTIYGIGKIVNISNNCIYLNYPQASSLSTLNYNEISRQILFNHEQTTDLNTRVVTFFKPAPLFFSNGVDMDDVLSSCPSAFKMLRALWKLSFIKVDDEEDKAIYNIIIRRNMHNVTNQYEFNENFHQRVSTRVNDTYKFNASDFINYNQETRSITHEMGLELMLLHQIANKDETCRNIFGFFDYISHQVIASPFKPIDYMDKMDIFGYSYIMNDSFPHALDFHPIDKYKVIELKKDVANEDVVNQIMNYVDFIRDEYAAGDYGQIQAFIVANTIPDDVVQRKNEIAKRYYTIDKRPPKSKEWNDLTLVEYKYNAVTKKLEFEIK